MLSKLEGAINDSNYRGIKIKIEKIMPLVTEESKGGKVAAPKKGAAVVTTEEIKPLFGEAIIDLTPL